MSSKDGKRKRPLVPRLRFPEFREAGEWEDVSLSNITKTITPKKKLQTSQYMLNGSYPIIDQSQLPVARWTDDVESVITRPLPLIIFGDHTCVLKLATQPFAQGADGIKIISVASSMITEYIFQYLLACPIVMKEYKRHFSDLIKRKVYYPKDFKEQQKIADCLSSLDERITLEAQKLEALKRHKKGLMQQLFPREGETLPRLRFPEFREAGEWEFQPLGKLAKRCTQKNTKGEYNRVLTNSAEHGVVDQRDYFEKDIANQGNLDVYYIVEKGDYVYNPRISITAPVGPVSKNNIGTGVMSPLYTVFKFNSNNNDFYDHYFKSAHWHHYMLQSSNTGARHDRISITNDDFMGLPLPVAKPDEQKKISDCLSSLDERITLEAQKLEALKRHKKGLMQQLFPVLDDGD